MVRVKRGKITRQKHKKVLKATKGMKGVRRSSIKKAKEAVIKALSYSYRDRRAKKRDFRKLWIIRLNNALAEKGISYSKFINQLKVKNIQIDRKTLSDLAVNDSEVFNKLVDEVKK
ncbi:50S ribosomal protein L20 [bacterium CG_4_10_14_0_2_um_filter_33_32]|nr:MAG: 50S ribosomal protein L20 [bacterium CG2_30_33_46]PIR67770.1 MAG: 50S ribosomal protein L20 [bacterium CG10_big_fil_rev_8_21_14_0_10_33_18]PIU76796.1 MAG: 50S ribosomal protein L20 [bacterium CG06_land_8_20_14_3_00_33_50]PIW81596.1 MAG: 50S ribosomal protein L20 [bacterium CG_4_8_14_3_um_filter_33_28]PIY85546.1 MAG: 50S ribosomal protein L20 [bacterium CG_4_10_14_0_8_um_filter_33_57]PIZ85525.1 MAG: 50S ribosomal protein L20 [bacterium CG_4_10_14_0_2_um_filter_33_32]PJA72346.1 MAG: 50S